MNVNYVSYLRVSTLEQGRSGLGLEAQRHDVMAFLARVGGRLLAEYAEIESGSHDDRAELALAQAHCRLTGATLLVAKLCRLSRDAAFTLQAIKAGPIVCADSPTADATMTGIRAVINQSEREAISTRTKAALKASKIRGTKLGGYRGGPVVDSAMGRAKRTKIANEYASRVGPIAADLRATGSSLRQIAATLMERDIVTPAGGQWTAHSVRLLLLRQAELAPPQ